MTTKGKTKETEEVLEDAQNKLSVEEIDACPICRKWMAFCIAEPTDELQESDSKKIEVWYREKQDFWDKNKDYLKSKGFLYESNITKALDTVTIDNEKNLEGCLLVVRIGSENRPAGPDDINNAYNMVNKALDKVKGVRVIVTHHEFHIEKISLPQLREVQSAVLSSVDPRDDSNPILRGIEV